MSISSYKDLIVWQKAMLLTKNVYVICKQLPKEERYILTSQMLRAAISIPSNIAEGHSRMYKADYTRFLNIAYASASELETQILISQSVYENIQTDNISISIDEIKKMLFAIIQRLK